MATHHLVSRSWFSSSSVHYIALSLPIALGIGLAFAAPQAHAMDSQRALSHDERTGVGRETGRTIPRFVSLKSGKVNLRVGPGRKYPIAWRYKRAGLPVEIIQEFSLWRRIRDSEGTTGWVLHSLLSGQRTALIAPWQRRVNAAGVIRASMLKGRRSASSEARLAAKLEAGLLAAVEHCTGAWCALSAQKTRFWIKQNKLWGVYPGEPVDQ
ncbi:MAG: SH3 domain-containing protein [Pseudomonadota bacterium]